MKANEVEYLAGSRWLGGQQYQSSRSRSFNTEEGHVPLSPLKLWGLRSYPLVSHFGSEPMIKALLLRLHSRTTHAVLTKLGYLFDNHRSNALDLAKAVGSVLADVLVQRRRGLPRIECRRRRLFAVPSPSLALPCGHTLPVPFSSGSSFPTKYVSQLCDVTDLYFLVSSLVCFTDELVPLFQCLRPISLPTRVSQVIAYF